jgi:hypothetical protein
MDCFVLQDFTTIEVASSFLTFTQGQEGWVDLGCYQDLVAFIDVRKIIGPDGSTETVNIDLQTAPVRDEAYFVSMIGGTGRQLSITTPVTLGGFGPLVVPLTKTGAAVPVSQWVRWQLITAGLGAAWVVTFRVYLAASFKLGARPRTPRIASPGGSATAGPSSPVGARQPQPGSYTPGVMVPGTANPNDAFYRR